MNRPTFFISSTIYDFHDLRSAIKFFLEEQGCKVLASECNDFKKSFDKHSYQACLDSIKQADYFVLLVGSRVGGWYSKDEKISITQKEYREAYKLQSEGSLKIINFVRSDIWNLRFDRSDLEKYLDTIELDATISKSIAHHPTKRMDDPGFIIQFIDEISRNSDTKAALDGKSEFPKGNWIHHFNTFRDITDVLQPEVFDGAPIEEAVMKRLLLSELRQILKKCLVKLGDDSIYSPENTIRLFYQEHNVEKVVNEYSYFPVLTKRWEQIRTFSVHLIALKLSPLILPQSLSSSVFLDFDHSKGVYTDNAVYKALHTLHQEIQAFNEQIASGILSVVLEKYRTEQINNIDYAQLEVQSMLGILSLFRRWSNIVTISKAIIHHLNGNVFVMPEIFDKSPIPSMNDELKNEIPTDEELDRFINEP